MSASESRRFLEDARDEASGYLGRELTDAEWAEAYLPAAQKLSSIIRRYGDRDGDRRQPWYLGKLVQEHITFNILSRYCAAMNRINPTPTETARDELKGYVQTLSPEVCLRAINKAIDGGVEKQNWNYIRGILRNLAKQKVRSVADWDRLEAEREQRKNGANRNNSGSGHGQQTGPPGATGPEAGIEGFHPADSADG